MFNFSKPPAVWQFSSLLETQQTHGSSQKQQNKYTHKALAKYLKGMFWKLTV